MDQRGQEVAGVTKEVRGTLQLFRASPHQKARSILQPVWPPTTIFFQYFLTGVGLVETNSKSLFLFLGFSRVVTLYRDLLAALLELHSCGMYRSFL